MEVNELISVVKQIVLSLDVSFYKGTFKIITLFGTFLNSLSHNFFATQNIVGAKELVVLL
jgi:hypothetical protein